MPQLLPILRGLPTSRLPHALGGALLCWSLFCAEARAGDGVYDPATRSFKFGVSVRFQATPQQLDRLRTLFTRASALIHDATDGQHRFGAIAVGNDSQGGSSAEFWILPEGRSTTIGRFGQKGDRSYLTMTDLEAQTAAADGAWVIAHEFARLAYGLAPEYAGPGAPSGRRCIHAADPATQTACLMDDYWNRGAAVGGVSEFCVASNHDHDHDTWQHAVHGHSCWETMVEQYPDLVPPAGLPVNAPGTPTPPTWNVLTADRRYFMVLDRSGSMIGERLEMAKLGARVFTTLSREGDKLGLMSFSWDPVINAPLAAMNPASRAALRQATSAVSSDNGATGMGWALLHARNHVLAAGPAATDMALLLLSDGQANHGPEPLGFAPEYRNSGIAIHTLALGDDADISTMQSLSEKTGGRSFSTERPFGLVPIFVRLLAEVTDGGLLALREGALLAGQQREVRAYVDATVTSATFIATWDGIDEGQVFRLRTPSGQILEASTALAGVRHERDATSATFAIEGAALQFGEWTLLFENPTAAAAHEYALSAIGYSEVIDLAARSDRSRYTWPQPMQITATAIYRGPIAGAQMQASVRRPNGPPVLLALNDQGLAGDAVSGDGIYSGLFDRWNGDGSYTVDVRASSGGFVVPVNGTAINPSTPTAPIDIAFERVQPFGVTMTGAPRILHSHLLIDKASFRVEADEASRGSLSLAGSFDAAPGDLDREVDDLVLEVGEIDYAIPGGALTRVGTKERFTFTDAAQRFRFDVELYVKGSSRARFRLRDVGVDAAALGDLSRVRVALRWGTIDVRQTILPEVRIPGADARFAASKQLVADDELAILKLEARDEIEPLADRIALTARVQGDLRPDEQTLTLRCGPFERVIPPTAWKRSGERWTLRLSEGALLLQGSYDRAKRSFTLRGSGFDFAGLVPDAAVGFSAPGAFNEFRELRLSAADGRYGY
ncbi:MAG: VWA domain-containing protein [Planctomycetes bacterium]|nr:VWA domain-containing protein [Planctomycetota bacterium]